MRIYGVTDECPMADLRPAVTMGVFDGVHLGHRAIFNNLREVAREVGAPTLAITFSPHPRQALGRSAPPGICTLETRLRLMGEAGLDAVWVLPFTQELSMIPGRAFAEEFFHRRLAARGVVLGAPAVFGRDRDGTIATLAQWSAGWHLAVRAVPPLIIDGAVVSSTAVRLAVQSGDLRKASTFLGRPVSVEGTVVHGQEKGRHLGFPTINLDPHHELRPPSGVYYTRAVIDGVHYPSITNIGRPPTEAEIEAGITDFLVESHLIDFEGDLYGRTAEILFYEKARDVQRFPRISGLTRQMEKDLVKARAWFVDHPEN